MTFETNSRIVCHGLRSGEQNQARLRRAGVLCAPDQLAPYAVALVRKPHGQIGEISRVNKVRNRSRNADEQVAIPCGDHEVRIGEHLAHPLAIVHWAPLSRRRRTIQFDDPIELEFEISDPRSPAELGLSADRRLLGIGLEWLSLMP